MTVIVLNAAAKICNREGGIERRAVSVACNKEETPGVPIPKKCIKKRSKNNVVEKFREVSGTVWVCLKGMITEKTIKEESSQNNHYNDNYNYNSDTITIFSTFQFSTYHVSNKRYLMFRVPSNI